MRHADVPEGFLLTVPQSFQWNSTGQHWVDAVPVSEHVYDLALEGQLAAARAAWLEDCESGKGRHR